MRSLRTTRPVLADHPRPAGLPALHAALSPRRQTLPGLRRDEGPRLLRRRTGGPSCAGCTGHDPIYACIHCGREDNPFGRKCAPCELQERLTDLLADPSGAINPELRPVFDALIAAPRPQSVHYWLTRASSRPDLLRAMARGDMDISHAAFEQLPPDRAVIYVRDLLAAVGVLPPYQASARTRHPMAARPARHPAQARTPT